MNKVYAEKHLKQDAHWKNVYDNFVLEYDKATYNWETHQKRLVKEITKARDKGYLTVDQ